jgi:Protein kinase domain
MHNVDQSTGFYSLQYPSELCSNVPGYMASPAHYGNINMAPHRQMTPPLDYQGLIQGGIQQQLPPTPRGTPPPYSPSQSQNEVVSDPRYQHFTAPRSRLIDSPLPSWSSYLDPAHRLQFQRTLGSGAYGVVHLAKDVTTQIHYAVKVLNKFLPNGLPLDLRQQQFQQTEMRLHYQVSAHPNIVSLLRIMDTPQNTYVIMEYCPEGDLFSSITERGRYVGDDSAAKKVFLQILDAVSHCHRLGIYHRDLKPENILVADDGHQVKLADFGLATTDPYATEFGCGSTFYMSPGRVSRFFSNPPSQSLTS